MDGENGLKCIRINDEEESTEGMNLFKMKRTRTKWWNVIRLIAPTSSRDKNWESKDAIGAWCVECKVKLQYKIGDVNAVKRHIESSHPILYGNNDEEGEKNKRPKTMTIKGSFSSVQNKELKPSSKADQKMGEALLVNWTATSLQPFTIIEDEGFLKFVNWMNSLRTNFTVPSQNKHRNQLVKLSDMVMKRVQEKMRNEMDYFAMTTDIWSLRVMESYMAETIHYLTEDFEMKTFTMEVTPFPSPHTAERILEFWEASFTQHGLAKEKLTIMLQDNASNGVKACQQLKIQHFGCIGHSIHLVLGPFFIERPKEMAGANESFCSDVVDEDDIEEIYAEDDNDDNNVAVCDDLELETADQHVRLVQQLVQKVQIIVKYIKNWPKAKEKVQSYLKEQNGCVLMVTLDVRTRWNSTFDMLIKFIQLKDGIQQFLVHLKSMNGKREFNRKCLPDLEEEDWALLSGVCVLCQPFKDDTTLLSEEKYPTFCHAFPLLRTLKSVLSQEDLFEETFLRQSRGSSHLHLLPYTTEDFYLTITLYLKACQRCC